MEEYVVSVRRPTRDLPPIRMTPGATVFWADVLADAHLLEIIIGHLPPRAVGRLGITCVRLHELAITRWDSNVPLPPRAAFAFRHRILKEYHAIVENAERVKHHVQTMSTLYSCADQGCPPTTRTPPTHTHIVEPAAV